VRRLYWVNPVLLPRRARLTAITVKQLTQLQVNDARTERCKLTAAFIVEAVGPPAAGVPPTHTFKTHIATLRRLWRLEWDLSCKEPAWRLPLDCFVMFGHARYGGTAGSCLCGEGETCRAHAFWGCVVARTVIDEIQRALPAGSPVLTREHVWLHKPPPGMQQQPWDVVCLAALQAMDHGRRELTRLHLRSPAAPAATAAAGPALLAAPAAAAPQAAAAPAAAAAAAPAAAPAQATGTQVLLATVRASESLWASLADFRALHQECMPRKWPVLPESTSPLFFTGPSTGLELHPRPPTAAPAATAATLPADVL
jgi:hypothetical protein